MRDAPRVIEFCFSVVAQVLYMVPRRVELPNLVQNVVIRVPYETNLFLNWRFKALMRKRGAEDEGHSREAPTMNTQITTTEITNRITVIVYPCFPHSACLDGPLAGRGR